MAALRDAAQLTSAITAIMIRENTKFSHAVIYAAKRLPLNTLARIVMIFGSSIIYLSPASAFSASLIIFIVSLVLATNPTMIQITDVKSGRPNFFSR